MKSKSQFIHPMTRVTGFVFGLLGILNASEVLLVVGYLTLLFVLFFSKQILSHLKLVLISGLPFLLLLIVVHGINLSEGISVSESGMTYANSVFVKIVMLMALFQFSLSIPSIELFDLLKYLRVKKYLKWIILESYSSLQELFQKTDQIITARLARGYVEKRNWFNLIKQVPFIIRPLLTGLLNSAFDKSLNWKQMRFMEYLSEMEESNSLFLNYPKRRSILISCGFFLWFLLTIINRFY